MTFAVAVTAHTHTDTWARINRFAVKNHNETIRKPIKAAKARQTKYTFQRKQKLC